MMIAKSASYGNDNNSSTDTVLLLHATSEFIGAETSQPCLRVGNVSSLPSSLVVEVFLAYKPYFLDNWAIGLMLHGRMSVGAVWMSVMEHSQHLVVFGSSLS